MHTATLAYVHTCTRTHTQKNTHGQASYKFAYKGGGRTFTHFMYQNRVPVYVYSGVYGKSLDEQHYTMKPLVIEAQVLMVHKTLNDNMLP